MRKEGIFLGLVGLGLAAVVGYHLYPPPVAAGLLKQLQPLLRETLFVMSRATTGIRQSATWATVVDHCSSSVEYVHRGIEQLPSGVAAVLRYLRSVPWMDHVHTTQAALQQGCAMGTAALAAIRHAVFVLESTVRATAPPEMVPYILVSIVFLAMWLVQVVLLAVIRIARLLVLLISIGLDGAGTLVVLLALYRVLNWLLVCILQTLALPVNALHAVVQFLARRLTVSLRHTVVELTKCMD